MKAAVYATHGAPEVLQVRDVQRPLRRADHVLVKVAAASVNPADVKFRAHPVMGMFRPLPKIPGADIAGIVEEAPEGSALRKGDRVFAMMPLIGSKWGACAQYASVPASLVVGLPDNVDLQEAASLPLVALTVVQGMAPVVSSMGGKTEGKKVLVQAGSGGVGTFAIQYCKHVLGMHVATTCSGSKADFVKSLGADVVVDYKTQQFEEVIQDYDVVFDTLGYLNEEKTLRSKVLKHDGHYIHIASSDTSLTPGEKGTDGLGIAIPEARIGNLLHLAFRKAASWFKGPHYHFVFVHPQGDDLQHVSEVLRDGKVRPVISKAFPLEQVAQAHTCVEKGDAKGKVIVVIPQE